MKTIQFYSFQPLLLLSLALVVACQEDSIGIAEDGERIRGEVAQVQGFPDNTLQTLPVDPFTFWFTMVFLIFNLLGLGESMHSWIGPVPPKPVPWAKQPYKVIFEM